MFLYLYQEKNDVLNFATIKSEKKEFDIHLCICLHGLHVLLCFKETELSAGHVICQGSPWG